MIKVAKTKELRIEDSDGDVYFLKVHKSGALSVRMSREKRWHLYTVGGLYRRAVESTVGDGLSKKRKVRRFTSLKS